MSVGRFFRWWGRELAACAPPSWRRGKRARRTLHFDIAPSEIVARYQSNNRSKELGRLRTGAEDSDTEGTSGRDQLGALVARLNPKKTRVLVTLPPDVVLSKDIELPLAAEENLRQVLSFEMERQTPFRADDVYFAHRVIARDARTQRVKTRFAVVLRRVVDRALSLVQDWDVQPSTMPGTPEQPAQGLTLLFTPRVYRSRGPGRVNAVLGVLALALLIAVAAVPMHEQRARLGELRAHLERSRAAAAEATAMQARVDEFVFDLRFLGDKKAQTPTVVETLNELTRLLPDSTWLFRFELKNNEVKLQGASDGASSLIALLEDSPMLQGVHFSSPVTRDPRSGGERFRLEADVIGRTRDLALPAG